MPYRDEQPVREADVERDRHRAPPTRLAAFAQWAERRPFLGLLVLWLGTALLCGAFAALPWARGDVAEARDTLLFAVAVPPVLIAVILLFGYFQSPARAQKKVERAMRKLYDQDIAGPPPTRADLAAGADDSARVRVGAIEAGDATRSGEVDATDVDDATSSDRARTPGSR